MVTEEPAFWLRGLPQKTWLDVPEMNEQQGVFSIRVPAAVSAGERPWDIAMLEKQGKFLYSDGSGGAFSQSISLRRCAWAIALIECGE